MVNGSRQPAFWIFGRRHVNAFFCKWLDSWVIRSAAARMPAATGCNPQLRAARELIDCDDLFTRKIKPAELQFTSKEKFQFPSPIQTPFTPNNTVHGRFFRCGEEWKSKPTVILLHGWNDEINHRF